MRAPADTQALIDNLTALCGQLGELYKLLQQEETALAENSYQDIEQLAAQKTTLTQQVEASEKIRQQICSRLNISANIDGIQAYIKHIDASAKTTIIKLWQRITILGQHCAIQNQLNGILVAHQQRRAREALNILRGHFDIGNRYSNKGAQESEQPRHSLGKV